MEGFSGAKRKMVTVENLFTIQNFFYHYLISKLSTFFILLLFLLLCSCQAMCLQTFINDQQNNYSEELKTKYIKFLFQPHQDCENSNWSCGVPHVPTKRFGLWNFPLQGGVNLTTFSNKIHPLFFLFLAPAGGFISAGPSFKG